ncbi:B12-binding domain-containing protein [Chloroflexota bacterium]
MAFNLVELLAELREEEVLKVCRERLEAGEEPLKILEDSRKGMEIVGKRFADGEYFIPELIFSGEILKQISEMVKPMTKGEDKIEGRAKIILGTVAGDIHDIGLNIVDFMLDVNGFDVCNTGIDTPSQKFVDAIKETGATIVGLSGFLTLAFDAMKETVEAIEAAGLRDKVKIMVGGGQVDEEIQKYTGADGYGLDAMAAVRMAKEWTGG